MSHDVKAAGMKRSAATLWIHDPRLGREIFFYSGSLRNTADDSGTGRSDSGGSRGWRTADCRMTNEGRGRIVGSTHIENWELKIENVEFQGSRSDG